MAERVVTPKDCAVLCCVPLDRARFTASLARPDGYVRMLARKSGWTPRVAKAAWWPYAERVVTPILRALNAAEELGAVIVTDVSVSTFVRTLAGPEPHVVCVLGHSEFRDSQVFVEFDRGPESFVDIVDRLPTEFDGVLDLGLCVSWRASEIVKERCPDCLTVSYRAVQDPSYRAAAVTSHLKFLSRHPSRYTDVLAEMAKRISR